MSHKGDSVPNVWGAGQLLAFSEVDGFTSWEEPVVLHTDVEPGNLLVRLPLAARVGLEGMPHAQPWT